jgi:hypothetical protein
MTSDESEEARLRVDNSSLRFPGQRLRLDLYRLISYFHASEVLSAMSDGDEFCPWQSLRDDFETQEIIRILFQTAVSVRFVTQGEAEDERPASKADQEIVGALFRETGHSQSIDLTLREACHKIVDAKSIVLDNNGHADPYRQYLKPRIFCYGEFSRESGWKAEINVALFVEAASSIAELYA